MKPTLPMLQSSRKLRVLNPENGIVFTVSLRDWNGLVFGVRVIPDSGHADGNPYCTKHRVMPKAQIEDWLSELELLA